MTIQSKSLRKELKTNINETEEGEEEGRKRIICHTLIHCHRNVVVICFGGFVRLIVKFVGIAKVKTNIYYVFPLFTDMTLT